MSAVRLGEGESSVTADTGVGGAVLLRGDSVAAAAEAAAAEAEDKAPVPTACDLLLADAFGTVDVVIGGDLGAAAASPELSSSGT